MKRKTFTLLLAMFSVLAVTLVLAADKPKKESVEDGKEAAKAPYANDLGPDTVDVSSYSVVYQKAYKGAFKKCAKCHKLSRVLNSQFLELKKKEILKLKKKLPEIFEKPLVWQIDESIWKRYVKRMMRKPGTGIKSKEGKAIWQFLVFDSEQRKLGKNRKKWEKHRQKLLSEFKKKYPERYQDIYGKEEEEN